MQGTKRFSRFRSALSRLLRNIWNSLYGQTPRNPSSYKKQNGGNLKKIIKKKNLPVSFHRHPPAAHSPLPSDLPLHPLLLATTSCFTVISLQRNGPLEVSQLDTTCRSPSCLCDCVGFMSTSRCTRIAHS